MKKQLLLAFATLLSLATFMPAAQGDELQKIWEIAPDDRTYITAGVTERGIAFNPATSNLLVVSRVDNTIYALNAADGAEVGPFDMTDVTGGTFPINMIGVADDGVIYAANLALPPTAGGPPVFKLYRWENESAVPTLAFEGDPGNGESNQRWGDSFDVRGSGTNTQILLGARASASMAVLTTTDGSAFTSTHIRNAGAGTGSISVAFGEGETAWLKLNGQPLRHVSFDMTTRNATLVRSFSTLPAGMAPIGISSNYLGGVVIATPDVFVLYDLSDPNIGPILVQSEPFPTDNPNLNNVGSVEFAGTRVYTLGTGNGLMAFEIVKNTKPAVIVQQPADQTGLVGADLTLSATVGGTPPLTLQWLFNDAIIPNATNTSLVLNDIQAINGGNYSLVVSNASGAITSSNAIVTVNPFVSSGILEKVWQIAPGDRPYVANDNNQRGISYNPVTTNLVLVSRTEGNFVYILNALTGEFVRQLNADPTIIIGGTFRVSATGVADDGAVYVANLTTDASTSAFAVYRWENDSADAVPTAVYVGDPSLGAEGANRRFGDAMTIRGGGADTQILIPSRNGTNVTILTPVGGDVTQFAATSINVAGATAGVFGLGVAFGEGNTFWGKGSGGTVRLVSFPDPVAAQDTTVEGTILNTVPATEIASLTTSLGYDVTNKFLAANTVENPDNLRLFDVSDLTTGAVLVDQEPFPTDNGNVNGTGAIDFGGGYLYVLNSNNGIMAFKVNADAAPEPTRPTLTAGTLTGANFTLTITGTANARYRIEATTDFTTWTSVEEVTIDADGSVTITDEAATTDRRFYRAVAL